MREGPPPCPANPPPPKKEGLPQGHSGPLAQFPSLHLVLCPLPALSFLRRHWPAPQRTAKQSKARPWPMVLHQTAAHQLDLVWSFSSSLLLSPPSSPSSFSLPISLSRLQRLVLTSPLGLWFSTSPHELFEFMISFTFHPCPSHSNLFLPPKRTSPRLAAPSVRPSRSRIRPREPTPNFYLHTKLIVESRPQTSCC